MKVVKWLAIILAVLVVLLVLVGFALPGNYSVERSVTIESDPATIHTLVGDLQQWDRWTPWKEADPTIETTFGEITSGVGASQSWTGESGTGRLAFTQCSPELGVVYDMSFDEGTFVSIGAVEYEKVEDGTRVTWKMAGEMGANPLHRLFGVMMDSMVGPMFENGLTRLKEEAESLPAPEAGPAT